MTRTKVILVESLIEKKKDHTATAHALGFKKTGKTIEREEAPQVRGVINKISYLLRVEEV